MMTFQHSNPPNTDQGKDTREQDLDVSIPDITWDVVIDRSRYSSIRLLQCYSELESLAISFQPQTNCVKFHPVLMAASPGPSAVTSDNRPYELVHYLI